MHRPVRVGGRSQTQKILPQRNTEQTNRGPLVEIRKFNGGILRLKRILWHKSFQLCGKLRVFIVVLPGLACKASVIREHQPRLARLE